MGDLIFAQSNGRKIPLEDKIFGISNKAKKMIAERGKDAVVNATIGALLDDNGNLIVLSSVVDVLKNLSPTEFAEYAPIGGIPEFRSAILEAALGKKYAPKCFAEAVATPGGTGSIRNTISNYSAVGDKVLTSDWYWAPYGTIASEIGRSIDTFSLFDEKGAFNAVGFEEKVKELLAAQNQLVIILNTPAHNPTGYALTNADWESVLSALCRQASTEKKVTILVDVAYIDFAGDEEECRSFLPLFEKLPENILPVVAYSLSKTFTLYGMRCGAMICLAKTKEIAEEFKRVCEYSSRGSWSNCCRAPQSVLAKIHADERLLAKVDSEREQYRNMLLARGHAFEQAAAEAGLKTVPFDAGFFASIPCDNPDAIAERLQEEGIFLIPLAKGLRVSIASVSEEKCRMLPKKIRAAMDK
ncbi:MAG: aminotransferase class I/II-fold pyridoxal phosphate-dependent enzyme [Clostridia bacterium]|nr:aminotransferase class I/II-fold pyridoxal phosphate-dependent enzyme [Clostridia bacterium]